MTRAWAGELLVRSAASKPQLCSSSSGAACSCAGLMRTRRSLLGQARSRSFESCSPSLRVAARCSRAAPRTSGVSFHRGPKGGGTMMGGGKPTAEPASPSDANRLAQSRAPNAHSGAEAFDTARRSSLSTFAKSNGFSTRAFDISSRKASASGVKAPPVMNTSRCSSPGAFALSASNS